MARAKITPDLLQKIKDSVNILDVVGEHVVLRKSGSNHSGLCPFHNERSPSFSVSESKQLYHCYGCKEGGDLVSFVMKIHGISFAEAVEELADRGKVSLPKDFGGDEGLSPEDAKRRAEQREKQALAWKLNLFVATFYANSLKNSADVTRYFHQRGVDDTMLRQFYAGFAPAGWDALATRLVGAKAPLPLAAELGLIRPSQKETARPGPGYFDLFRNRAMFPILDLRGKVAGFGGRKLDKNDEGPKYINSSESMLFHKSKIAYGLYQAQKHIREKDEIILVEGYFDTIALHAAGFPNAVATCGTSLTQDHLKLFSKFAKKLVVLFDGDKAGIQATERAMEIGLENGWVIYGAVAPAGKDPDEILFDQTTGAPLSGGREQMAEIIGAAKPLLDLRMSEAYSSASRGSEDRSSSVKQIARWLSIFSDGIGRETRMQEAAERLGVSPELLRQAMGQGQGNYQARSQGAHVQAVPQIQPQAPRPQFQTQRSPQPLRALRKSERFLLEALVVAGKYAAHWQDAMDQLPTQMPAEGLFEHTGAREVLKKLVVQAPQSWKIDQTFVTEVQDSEIRSLLTAALVSEGPTTQEAQDAFESELKLSLNRRVAYAWARFSHRLKTQLMEAEAKKDADLYRKLSQDYLDAKRKKVELNKFYDEE